VDGTNGTNGINGTARAYGLINPGTSPTLNASYTKDFTGVTHITTGVYCLAAEAGINPAGNPVFLTVEFVGTSSPREGTTATWYRPAFDCPAGAYEILTLRAGVGLVDNVAFAAMVP